MSHNGQVLQSSNLGAQTYSEGLTADAWLANLDIWDLLATAPVNSAPHLCAPLAKTTVAVQWNPGDNTDRRLQPRSASGPRRAELLLSQDLMVTGSLYVNFVILA